MLSIFRKGRKPAETGKTFDPDPEELVRLVTLRAENYFTAHGLSCSETVLLVLNRGFGGGLSAETSLGLGSGFGGGIGNAGCVCGALSGAVMALGLFLGPGRRGGLSNKAFRRLVGGLHERFRERSGSVCCRELMADFRHQRRERRSFCNGLTGWTAGEATRLMLAARPELAGVAELEFLAGRDSRVAALIERFVGRRLSADQEKNG